MDEDEKEISKEIAQRLVNALNEILKEKGSRLNSDTLFHAVEGFMISCYGSACASASYVSYRLSDLQEAYDSIIRFKKSEEEGEINPGD